MSKELVIEPKLNICIDHGVNENDYSVATITLYYNYTLYVIYQTDNKEQIKALDEIRKVERLKDERLESIDNANPSEALEGFRGFKNGIITDNAICITKSYFDDKFPVIESALIKAQEQEKVLNELLMLINDLEPTLDRKGMVSIDDDNLGTFIKDYFIDNASDLLKRWIENGLSNDES